MKVSERRVCRALGQHRSTQRRLPKGRADEERLVADMIELTRQYGRYGYRRVAALLRDAGWQVNDKRVERLWRREGLKVPVSQPKKGRLWMNDGSCVRLRPEYQNHVWSYDFVHHRTDDGRAFRTLNILDEYSRECLAIRVKRKLNSIEVIDALTDLFILRGVPSYIRSDNGPEFIAAAVRDWIKAAGAKTAYIEPGSPWENGYCESFNGRQSNHFFSQLKNQAGLIPRSSTTDDLAVLPCFWPNQMGQQYGCDQCRLAVLSCHRQVRTTGAVRVIKHIQNKLALELHQLDWLTNLSAFWD